MSNLFAHEWQSTLPCIALGLWALALRITQGSWFAPGAAWAIFWWFGMSLPLLLAPSFPVSSSALWVIVLLTVIIGIGAEVGMKVRSHSPSEVVHQRFPLHRRLVLVLLLLSLVAALVVIEQLLAMSGASLSSLNTVSALAENAHKLSVARYGGTTESVATRLLLTYVYFCSILGGATFPRVHSKIIKLLTLCPLAGALAITTVSSAKAGFLFCVILWISAFIVQLQQHTNRPIRLSMTSLLRVGAVIALICTIFISLLWIRYGSQNETTNIYALLDSMKIYLFGHLSVFSGWWEFTRENGFDVQFGKRLFFGPAAFLGLNERVLGAYDLVQYKQFTLDSNVFSTYRALIEDFSLPGAAVVSFILGFAAGIAYRNHFKARSVVSPVVLSAFYAFLLSSHVNNIFGYTTIFAAFLAYAALMAAPRLPTLRPP